MDIDLDQIKKLLDVVSTTDVTELTIESGEEKITIKKQQASVASLLEIPATHHQVAPSLPAVQTKISREETAPPGKEHEDENNGKGLISINSPMVGTFYRSSSPSAPPFVDIGDLIAPGQTICIIEAMKLMNDLPAEVSGRVVRCCVENGTTVEYGQPLFMVNPKV